jgi:Anti-sigma-K factor rskA/Putative zinc-finger
VTAHHEAWELLPDIAAGTMPAGEREALEEHLDDCPICRAELDTLRSAVELLRGAPAPLDPPASLRARVLSIPEAAERAAADKTVPVLGQKRARRSSAGGSGSRRAALVAAVVAVAAVAALVGVLAFRDNGFQADRTVSMRDGKGSWARAEFGGSTNGDVALQLKAHLPPVGKGWYYEVWLGKPDARLSIGDFTVGQSRDATVRLNLPKGSTEEYIWIWVTREQDDGDPDAGPVVLRAPLASA